MAEDVIESMFKYDFGFSVFKFRYLNVQNGYTYDTHSHDHIEIGFVKEGSCTMLFGDESQEFTQGETMVIYPNAWHSFATHDSNGCGLIQLEFRINNLSVLEFKENPDDNLLPLDPGLFCHHAPAYGYSLPPLAVLYLHCSSILGKICK